MSVRVTNTGPTHKGKEVVQAYIEFPTALNQPPRLLRAFKKTGDIAAGGGSELVVLKVAADDLLVWSESSGSWVDTTGSIVFHVGTSSRYLPLTAEVVLNSSPPSLEPTPAPPAPSPQPTLCPEATGGTCCFYSPVDNACECSSAAAAGSYCASSETNCNNCNAAAGWCPASAPGCSTQAPASEPTPMPVMPPSREPSLVPSNVPVPAPTYPVPKNLPSQEPFPAPSQMPSLQPFPLPSAEPSARPEIQPTHLPTIESAVVLSSAPTSKPAPSPTSEPVIFPTLASTTRPITLPTDAPAASPSSQPMVQPAPYPSARPVPSPSSEPASYPTLPPTSHPVVSHTNAPAATLPTPLPTVHPTRLPSPAPTSDPIPGPTAMLSARDAVSMDVSLFVSANEGEITESVVVEALVGKLGGANPTQPGTIRNFAVAFMSRRAAMRRFLLGQATVSFEVHASLSALGLSTASAFEESLTEALNTAINEGTLSFAIQTGCGCTALATSASVLPTRPFPTLEPTSVPVPDPSRVPFPAPSSLPVPNPTLEPVASPTSPVPSPGPTCAGDDTGTCCFYSATGNPCECFSAAAEGTYCATNEASCNSCGTARWCAQRSGCVIKDPTAFPSTPATVSPSHAGPATESASSCVALGWANAASWGSSSVCGESDLSLGGCSGSVTWSEARSFCEAGGARLCTVSELQANEARSTGCGLDRTKLWSADACDGGFMLAFGASFAGSGTECSSSAGVHHARCCADVGAAPSSMRAATARAGTMNLRGSPLK